MADAINVGGIIADLAIDSTNLDRGLANARTAMEATQREIQRLQAELKAGNIGTQAHADRVAALTATYNQLQAATRAAYDAHTQLGHGLGVVNAQISGAAEGASARLKGLTNAAIQLGRASQDVAQGGWAAGLNNVEGIAYGVAKALGSTAGQANVAAGALQGIGVIAYLVATNWDRMLDAMGVGIPAPAFEGLRAVQEELKKTMAEIDAAHKKARLGADERKKLDDNEKAAKALGAVEKEEKAVEGMEGPTREEQERAGVFKEAVKQQGGGEVVREMLAKQFGKQADAEGQTLSEDDLTKKVKAATGVDLSQDGVMTRQQVEAIETTLGVKLDSDKMQAAIDRVNMKHYALGHVAAGPLGGWLAGKVLGGPSLEQQVKAALQDQKFLGNEMDGFHTPGELARKTIAEGERGDKDAAEDTRHLLDKEVATEAGDPNGLVQSEFSKVYNVNSPEDKAKDEADKTDDARAKKAAEDAAKRHHELAEEEARLTDEQLKREEEEDRKRRKFVDEQARNLARGDLGLAALDGSLSEDAIRQAMVRAGVKPDHAGETAGDVREKLGREANDKVQAHALERGQTAAESRREMIAEARDRRRDEEERRRKDAAKDVERDLPGVGDVVGRLTLQAIAAGNNPVLVRAQIAELLKQRGIRGDKAGLAADGLVNSAGEEIRQKISQRMMHPDLGDAGGERERRRVEQFDATDLAAKVQASVGGRDDPQHKQVDLQEQMVKLLADMASKGQWVPKFK